MDDTEVRRLRDTLRPIPPTGQLGSSEVTPLNPPGEPSFYRIHKSQWQTTPVPSSILPDPPWIDSFVAGTAPIDQRTAPPTFGVPQHSTMVEIVLGSDQVLLDGVPVPKAANGKYWLPRFREQEVDSRRVVGPVFVALRMEDGTSRPEAASVVVTQTTYDDGVKVMPKTDVNPSYAIRPYSVLDGDVEVVTIPYPAWITRTPTLSVIDNDGVRRHAARAQVVAGSRLWAVVTAATARGVRDADASKLPASLAKILIGIRGEAQSKQMWRTAFLKVVPNGGRFYDVGTAVWRWAANQYAGTVPPPDGEQVDIPIPDLKQIIRRIIETRAGGSMEKDRGIGMTPAQMRKAGYRADSAVLDWLVYGEKSRKNPGIFGALNPLNYLPGGARTNNVPMGGNTVNPAGLDPIWCAESRCEYAFEVRITEFGGKTRVIKFDALRANGLDAGMIMAGYEQDRKDLLELTTELYEKLKTLGGTNWITDRLYITDSLSQGSASATSEDARRFRSYIKKDESVPLVISPEKVKNRMLKLVLGSAESDAHKQQRAEVAYGSGGVLDPSVAKLPNVRAQAMTQQQYSDYMDAAMDLYRQTIGVSLSTEIDQLDTGFLRWCDLYVPFVPTRHNGRLHAYVVPKPVKDELRAPPDGAVRRRLPQVAIFKSKQTASFGKAAVLTAIPVEQAALSKRTNAKSAVDAARATWKQTAVDFDGCIWTLEPSGTLGFHTIELALSMPDLRAVQLPVGNSWNHYLWVTGVTGRIMPGGIGRRVYDYEQVPTTSLIQAREVASSVRGADAALMMAHRLQPSLLSWMALSAMSNAIVYAVLERGTEFKLKDTINNAFVRARAAAAFAADIIDLAYGKASRQNALLSLDDIVWACVPHAGLAHSIVRELPIIYRAWRDNAKTGKAYSPQQFEKNWPRTLREQSSEFARALRTLSRAKKVDLQLWPFTNLQSLVIDRTRMPIDHKSPYQRADSGLNEQLQAATSSFLRVRRLLTRVSGGTTVNHFWCLVDAVASRPVVLQVAESQDKSGVLTLDSLLYAQRDWKLPEPRDRYAFVRSLVASRIPALNQLMGNLSLKELGSAPLAGTAIKEAAAAAKYEYDSVLVPPCGFAEAGMLDVSDTQALEDMPVWLEAVREQIDLVAISPPEKGGASSVDWALKVDTQEHPYVLRLSPPTVQGVLDVGGKPEEGSALLGNELPSTILDTCRVIRTRPIDEVVTGNFSRRKRALVWLVDRFIQVQMVAIATKTAEPAVHRIVCDVASYTATELTFVAAAAMIASAARATRFAWQGELRVIMPREIEEVRRRLQVLRSVCTPAAGEPESDPLKAMPLAELCHAVVAILE